MALSDLTVFSRYVYTTSTEVIKQQIQLFNAASRNAFLLSVAGDNQGDYSDEVLWAKISGLVKRRNAYGSGSQTLKTLTQLVDTMVKVASGTPPIEINPGMLKWIKSDPEKAGVMIGRQLAGDAMGDMLNTGIMACKAALSGVAAVVVDQTGATPDTLTPVNLNAGTLPFGDQAASIVCWVVHSTPMNNYYGYNLANAQNLFTYGTINVLSDAFGRVFIVTDSPALVTAGSPNIYNVLGLVPGAVRVEQNADEYTDNIETKNGDENILRTFQAEWTYNLGILGFSWDKANGGKSPTDNALATSSNWDRFATSVKDLAGVMLKVN